MLSFNKCCHNNIIKNNHSWKNNTCAKYAPITHKTLLYSVRSISLVTIIQTLTQWANLNADQVRAIKVLTKLCTTACSTRHNKSIMTAFQFLSNLNLPWTYQYNNVKLNMTCMVTSNWIIVQGWTSKIPVKYCRKRLTINWKQTTYLLFAAVILTMNSWPWYSNVT